ncbi:MAG: DUF6048 family protein [Muribaculaceae bacterium]
MRKLIYIMIMAMAATAALHVAAQTQGKRFVTPVEQKTNRTLLPRKGEKLKYIERDSLVLDSLRRDSIAKIYPKYPIITDITVGVNVWDGIARLFSQDYSSFDVSASVNMWNRISPVVELGVGWANSTPEELNFTYKGKLAPYAKLGCNYNFMFKSHPDYQLFAGLRVGYSTFTYDITNITLSDGYWDENRQIDLLNQKSHALWGELALGIKVKLWRSISAGWTVKYHNIFNYKKNPNGDPWFIPGFGTRESKLNVGMTVYYTLPTSKKKWPKIDENGRLLDINHRGGEEQPADTTTVNIPADVNSVGAPAAPAESKAKPQPRITKTQLNATQVKAGIEADATEQKEIQLSDKKQ